MLRSGQERTQMATTDTIAAMLSQNPEQLYPFGIPYDADGSDAPAPLYFHPLTAPLWIDGYDDGWENIPAINYSSPSNSGQKIRYRTATDNHNLYLFIEVSDSEVVYNNPARSLMDDGDRLVIVNGEGKHYTFAAEAPGKITTRYKNKHQDTYRESKISAHWQDTVQGYNVEISMPFEVAAQRLGLYIIDEDKQHSSRFGPFDKQSQSDPQRSPPLFIFQPPSLQRQLAIFEQAGEKLKLVDKHYWLLSQHGSFDSDIHTDVHWVLRRLNRSLLNSQRQELPLYQNSVQYHQRVEVQRAFEGSNTSQWYRETSRSDHRVLASSAAIRNAQQEVIAVIVSEQSSEHLAALSDNAFHRLFFYSLGAISFTALGLLAYASWLSWRIRRLSRAALEVLGEDGKLLDNFPESSARDEVGELTRSYAVLLHRVREYTEYLQTLSRKLSHELRTPLAIVNSSLDNLANQALDDKSQIYQQRAKDGTLRLGAILTAMSEASRVEETIENAEPETIDIVQLLNDVTAAYRDLYQQQRIEFSPPSAGNNTKPIVTVQAMPDLLVQMLDKLMDNAASFCPTGGLITFDLKLTSRDICISVSNEGPILPEKMHGQLFDNMVSLRDKDEQSTHLGLGLHIVNLIARAHGGYATAANLSDNSGVIFSCLLPH